MNTPALSVRDLRRSYGSAPATITHRLFADPFASSKDTRFEAVRGVSFDVRRGELFALLGTNGAGKTSTLEVLEGLARADAGTVRVLGLDPQADRAALRPRIGIMLQEAGFPDGLTAGEFATGWARTLPNPRPVDDVLAQVGLAHRRDVTIANLSGGERRRLDLAVALLGRPELLFLDEPTTGLDPQSRHQVWQLVRDLLDEGTTVVLTTHYLEEAERLADRIAIMRAGRIVAEGSLAELVATQPATISFRLDPQTPTSFADQLHDLPGGSVAWHEGRVTVTTHQLQPTLTRLLTLADGVAQLHGLDARSASLEQAFLSIAGDDQDNLEQPTPGEQPSHQPTDRPVLMEAHR